MNSRKIFALSAAAALVGLNLAPSAHAVIRSWNVGTGNWGSSGNWTPAGTPTSADVTFLNRLVGGQRGVVSVVGTGHAATSVSIRQLNQLDIANFSSLNVGGDILVGYGDSVGFLNVNSSQPGIIFFNGNLTVGNTLRLGFESSSGIVNQNDGTVTVNQLVRVGDRHATSVIFPGTGRYSLSGVGVLNAARLEVGYGGDSSQFACEGEMNVSGNSTLNISLGAQIPDPKIGGNGGIGTLNQTGGTINSPFRIISIGSNSGAGTFNHSGGTFSAVGVNIGNTGAINYTGGANLDLGQVSTVNGQVKMGPGGGKTLRTRLLFTSTGTWSIDVNDNQLVVGATLGEAITTSYLRGRNGGAWNGSGIRSSAAANDPQHATTIGMMSGADYHTLYGPGATFGGQTMTDTQTLFKYTFYGDTDFNGIVDFDDYSRIDAGFNNNRTGWINGDFDFNGIVDFDDYSLIDLAFNSQTGVLATVPEPAALGALIVCGMGITGRQTRRSKSLAICRRLPQLSST
ncbi:MAG: hypothetical protein H7Z14_16810 [Anaerolineae bacterium]|nr:hypothetical protein [Phycisphaerae bacterium]